MALMCDSPPSCDSGIQASCILCVLHPRHVVSANAVAWELREFWGLCGLHWWLRGKESSFSARATGDASSVPGLRRFPGEGHATYSSILAWRIPWAEEPGRLQSMGLQKVGYDWGANTLIFWQRKAVFDTWPTSTVSTGIQEGSKNNILDVIQERITMIDFLDTTGK